MSCGKVDEAVVGPGMDPADGGRDSVCGRPAAMAVFCRSAVQQKLARMGMATRESDRGL